MKSVMIALACAAVACAQSDGIRVTVSRSATVQADQVEATIVVTTAITVTDKQVADVLQAAGLASRLISASLGRTATLDPLNASYQEPLPEYTYTFLHTAAGWDWREPIRKLEALRTSKQELLKSVNYGVGLGVSERASAEQWERMLPALLVDARKRAEGLASAGGLTLGALRSLVESPVAAAIVGAARRGAFVGLPAPVTVSSSLTLSFGVTATYSTN